MWERWRRVRIGDRLKQPVFEGMGASGCTNRAELPIRPPQSLRPLPWGGLHGPFHAAVSLPRLSRGVTPSSREPSERPPARSGPRRGEALLAPPPPASPGPELCREAQ